MGLALRMILSLSLFSLCGFSVADTNTKENDTVYKGVDEKGNVIFSDRPIPGSKPVEVKPNVVETEGILPTDSGAPASKSNNGSDPGTGSTAADGAVPRRGRVDDRRRSRIDDPDDRPRGRVDKPKEEPHKPPRKHFPHH